MIVRYVLPLMAVMTLVFAIQQMGNSQQQPPKAVPPVEPAKSPYATRLAGAGLVEPETENISIGTHLPGILESVTVKVGDTVKTGMPLFKLDDRQLRSELAVREANLASARAQLGKLDMMPRPEELPAARATILENEANLRDQQIMYERLKKLDGTTAVSEDELSRRQMAVEMAKAQLAKARASLALLEAGAWSADKQVAAAAVKQSEAMVNQTNIELGRLTVAAPALDRGEFKVLQVNVRPGEFVGAQPGQALILLGAVGRLHVRVDIDESDIPRFVPNMPGVAKPRGNPNVEFPIRFVRVEPYVIPKRSLTGSSLERVDTRVLQVIYALETKGNTLYVGQQMDVFLDAK
jgi:multidrug efflux pump subunit AcrA (membrane-fusion protein)